jgi:SPP1 gp7 family putative phage head morphogenesis protein
MVEQARVTAATVRTAADAEAFGRAMRRAWSDERVRRLVVAAGAVVEREASRPFATLASRLDVAPRTDASPRELVEAWAKTATAKITSVRDDAVEGMRRDIVAALEKGTDPAELAARWARQGIPLKWGTLEGRVKVIAQHQIASLHAHVGATRAQALGITSFVWRSQGDSRVRPHHRDLDGTRHAYAEPPSEGLPGQPVNCRCWAESIVDADMIKRRGPRLGKAPEQAPASPTPRAARRPRPPTTPSP